MKNTKYILIIAYLFPIIVLAQQLTSGGQPLSGAMGLLASFQKILSALVPVMFGLSMVYFFWGVAQFILHDAGNDKTRAEGQKKIIWGLVALFVFISIYGILYFIGGLVGITPGGDFSGIFGP